MVATARRPADMPAGAAAAVRRGWAGRAHYEDWFQRLGRYAQPGASYDAARRRLAAADREGRADAGYRLGWNGG